MLRRTSRPRLVRREGHGERKSIYLQGPHPAVSSVAKRRAGSEICRQYPTEIHLFPTAPRIHVIYLLADDGFIVINRVAVKKADGKEVCFYDRETGQVGTHRRRSGAGEEHIYLEKDDLVEIVELIGKIEDKIAVKRLAHLGPQIFPKRRAN